MTTGLSTIPIELVDAILAEIPPNSTELRNLRLVNKPLYAMATPNAFRRVRVANTLAAAKGLKSIETSSSIAPLVQELAYDDRSCGEFQVSGTAAEVDRT